MAATVIVRSTIGQLADLQLSTKPLMREIGLLARERLILRTLSGVDEHGARFAPYSKGYALRKSQALGSARVNLQASGAMLNAIVITEVTDASVTLGFSA
jgi:hypothetical protein